ncbi:MAG: hypothetical protein GEV06_07120 [Luteitalea sp.]|nr:hypothetical protein [Luteitalea sp.]
MATRMRGTARGSGSVPGAWSGTWSGAWSGMDDSNGPVQLARACHITSLRRYVGLFINVSETVLTKNDHQLVTTGPYRWVRHPLYTTGVVLFSSIGLMAGGWLILLWAVIALIAVRLVVIPREETHLVSAFGDEYPHYRRGTGSMLPLFLSARSRGRAG